MNTKAFNDTKQAILEDPFFDMGEPSHCLIGNADKVLNGTQDEQLGRYSTKAIAHQLGITDNQFDNLFYYSKWPKRFQTDSGSRVTTCARIDYFIETNGEDRTRLTSNPISWAARAKEKIIG